MTKKTKKIILLTTILSIASIVAYKTYKKNKAQKLFAKPKDEKSNATGFEQQIVKQYKNPLWIM